MANTICFFSGPDDDEKLIEFSKTHNLKLLPINLLDLDKNGAFKNQDNPKERPGCYLSFLPIEELKPYKVEKGKALINVSLNPVLQFRRSYFDPPNLIAGHIRWDCREKEKEGKSYFNKLARWIRKNWHKRLEDGYYIGPHATRIIYEERANALYLPPNVKIETVYVGRKKK